MIIKIKNILSQYFAKFVENIKKNKKQILIQYIIFLCVFATFLFIDQITKTFVFVHGSVVDDTKNIGETLYVKNPFFTDIQNVTQTGPEYVLPEQILPYRAEDWANHSIIGVRSIWHKGVTFLPSNVNIDAIQAVSMIIFIFTLIVPLLSKNKALIVTISIIASGAMGNMLDRFIFAGYVKDLFYWPFLEGNGKSTGTFNFADIAVIGGAIATVIALIIEFVLDFLRERKKKKEDLDSENTINTD